ncbi:uncharacterized protein LOC143460662 isoform X3 [Clavelina lepadiformis]|uniref:uncharacterized protein LOC143460662 isoform X3 n=1 Tax=Clavelina lepadiformis TaxID=159417 RepID=UPI0040432770
MFPRKRTITGNVVTEPTAEAVHRLFSEKAPRSLNCEPMNTITVEIVDKNQCSSTPPPPARNYGSFQERAGPMPPLLGPVKGPVYGPIPLPPPPPPLPKPQRPPITTAGASSSASSRHTDIVTELMTLRGSILAQVSERCNISHPADMVCQVDGRSIPLERFPNKLQSTSNGTQSINVHSSAVGVATSKAATKKSSTLINTEEEDSSRYLLSCLDEVDLTEAEKEEQAKEDNHRSLFVQELLFSMLSSDNTDEKLPSDSDNTMLLSMERATPVDCALLSTTPTYASQTQESSKNVSFSKTTHGDRDGSTKSDADEKKVPENSSCSNSVSDENRDTVLVNSMLAGNSTSAVSLQVDRNPGERLEEAPVVSSRSAPSLSPENRLLSEAQQWRCRDADVDSDKESDEDKPPSPTPVQPQHLALRLPGRVFASGSGPVRLSAPAPDYGREDVASASLNKNIR